MKGVQRLAVVVTLNARFDVLEGVLTKAAMYGQFFFSFHPIPLMFPAAVASLEAPEASPL